jgi:hypothetical protein
MTTRRSSPERASGGGRALERLLRPLVSAGIALSCSVGEDLGAPPASPGKLRGVVRLAGTPPPPEPVTMKGAPVCQSLNPQGAIEESVIPGANGGLANAFVYVVGADEEPGSSPAQEALILEERDCRFRPRVVGARTGQLLRIVNRDPTVHDPTVDASDNRSWSQTQPFAGMALEGRLEHAEVMIPVRCSIHPWMQAWVGVLDHPHFAVTDAAGEFTIDGLAAGPYRLEVWHEELGRRQLDVAIAPGEFTVVEIALGEVEHHVH